MADKAIVTKYLFSARLVKGSPEKAYCLCDSKTTAERLAKYVGEERYPVITSVAFEENSDNLYTVNMCSIDPSAGDITMDEFTSRVAELTEALAAAGISLDDIKIYLKDKLK